jgi:cell division ATPase FtsA
MAAGLGLGVGGTNAVAVLHTTESPRTGAEPATIARRATLQLTTAGEAILGPPLDAPDVISGFAAHAGDPAGLVIGDGSAYLAEDLVATAMHSLVHEAAEAFPGLSEQPEIIAIHPARWSDATAQSMRDALAHVGLAGVTLVPEPVAAVAWLEAAHGTLGDAIVAVFDLGGAGLDISLVRTGTGTDAGLLRPSTFTTRFGGDTFDQAVLEHVLGSAAGDLGPVDLSDPATRAELSVLRRRCAEAKEALSTATETQIAVELAGAAATVTLLRSELEELLESSITGSLDLVEQTISAHDLALSDVCALLLTGGGSAMPLVSRLAEATIGLPVVMSPRPGYTGAHGASLIAAGGAASDAVTTAAVAATVAAVRTDIDGDADTVIMPAVSVAGPPTAFTEAGPGRPVLPVLLDPDPVPLAPAAATPIAAAPRFRFRRTTAITAAAGVILAVALVGLVVSLRSTDAPATAVPVIAPSPTPKVTVSLRPTTTTTKAPASTTARSSKTSSPASTAPTTTAAPTTQAPPPVITTPPAQPSPSQRPTTTTRTTTTPKPTTTTEATTTTTETTTKTTTTTTAPEDGAPVA